MYNGIATSSCPIQTGECDYSLPYVVFGWNLLGLIVITLWSGLICGALFYYLNKKGWLRVHRDIEIRGLDIYKHGEPAYPTAAYGHGWDDEGGLRVTELKDNGPDGGRRDTKVLANPNDPESWKPGEDGQKGGLISVAEKYKDESYDVGDKEEEKVEDKIEEEKADKAEEESEGELYGGGLLSVARRYKNKYYRGDELLNNDFLETQTKTSPNEPDIKEISNATESEIKKEVNDQAVATAEITKTSHNEPNKNEISNATETEVKKEVNDQAVATAEVTEKAAKQDVESKQTEKNSQSEESEQTVES